MYLPHFTWPVSKGENLWVFWVWWIFLEPSPLLLWVLLISFHLTLSTRSLSTKWQLVWFLMNPSGPGPCLSCSLHVPSDGSRAWHIVTAWQFLPTSAGLSSYLLCSSLSLCHCPCCHHLCNPHSSSLLHCVTLFSPLYLLPSSSLSDQILPSQLGLRSLSSTVVSTVHEHLVSVVWLYLVSLCCQRVLFSSFKVSWQMVFVFMRFGYSWVA